MKLRRRIGIILVLVMVFTLLTACGETCANGHNYGSWVSNNDGTHSRVCVNNNGHVQRENCSGGTATCTEQATCAVCNTKYGSPLSHVYDNDSDTTCNLCNAYRSVSVDGFNYADIPAYTTEPYVVVNNNVPFFTAEEITTVPFERYSALDSLSRCGVAFSCLAKNLMPAPGTKGDYSHIKPTGWKSKTYEILNNQTIFNRSHLIAWFLGGDDVNNKNIITGTMSMNQNVMTSFENLVGDYLKETNNHVLYRVTPVFVGNELVARGVLMEAKSVEDNGEGIEYCVFCYNVEDGIVIDYLTGDSSLEGTDPNPTVDPTVDPNLTKATYNFATSSKAKGTTLNETSALTLFNASSTVATPIVSVGVTKVFNGNGAGGAFPSTPGMLKLGTSGENGELVLTFGNDWKVVKIEIKCHDFYKKSADYPTNSNKVSVNGSTAQLAPYNENGTGGVLTFNLDSASNVVAIDILNADANRGGRIFIFEIIVYFE